MWDFIKSFFPLAARELPPAHLNVHFVDTGRHISTFIVCDSAAFSNCGYKLGI